jgi:hypothetical protein
MTTQTGCGFEGDRSLLSVTSGAEAIALYPALTDRRFQIVGFELFSYLYHSDRLKRPLQLFQDEPVRTSLSTEVCVRSS